jgi:hypothetical protein
MYTLVNNLGVEVVYQDTVGRQTELRSGGRLSTAINPGASVSVGGLFKAPVVMPSGDARPDEPVTRVLLPSSGGVQYVGLQTTTSDTVVLHGSQWRHLLVSNATSSPASIRLGNNKPLVVAASSKTVVPVPLGLVDVVNVTSTTGTYLYRVNPALTAAPSRVPSLDFRAATSAPAMYVSKQTPGVWAQVGIIETPDETYIGGWTISGPPATLLAESSVLPEIQPSCKT